MRSIVYWLFVRLDPAAQLHIALAWARDSGHDIRFRKPPPVIRGVERTNVIPRSEWDRLLDEKARAAEGKR